MLRIGITGGIGTGKSFVCNLFQYLGIPVYDADLRAKQLVNESESVQQKIREAFGPESFTQTGEYNRKFIGTKIFQHPEMKQMLEQIIHPAVREDTLRWFERNEKKHLPYVLKEAALLFESGSYADLDKIIVVDAPMELRIERIKQRDGLTENEIISRMNSQWPQEVKLRRADYVINNDGKSSLIPKVWAIHHVLLKHSALSL